MKSLTITFSVLEQFPKTKEWPEYTVYPPVNTCVTLDVPTIGGYCNN